MQPILLGSLILILLQTTEAHLARRTQQKYPARLTQPTTDNLLKGRKGLTPKRIQAQDLVSQIPETCILWQYIRVP
jgi:hypothetical protein